MAKAANGQRTGEGKKRYEQLKLPRINVLAQAREASRVTLPGLIPAEGASDPHAITEQPYTSSGARNVNNVSAKLLLALFPPEQSFFQLDIDAQVAKELGEQLAEAQAALATISQNAMVLTEESASRTIWMEAIRHLVVAGNVMTYQPDDGAQMRMWRLDQFVVVRGRDGLLQEAVINDQVYPSELDPKVIAACNIQYDPAQPDKNDKVDLYTHIYTNGASMEHYEEINGIEVPESRGSVDKTKTGWQALRWQAVPGSDYGRSHVTEYAGDFLSLEDGNKSILKFAIEAARILRIVDPNAGIDVEELAAAESGDFLTGMRDRISTLQLDKSSDFQIVWQQVEAIEQRLAQAFLVTGSVIRNAERVTAEEIRAVAQELEDSLGGTYTVLSAEVQRPYANRLLYILQKQGKAPPLPADVKIVIVTGFNALGRNHETAAIAAWLQDLLAIYGAAWVAANTNGNEVALRLGVGRGVKDVQGLLTDPAKVAQDANMNALREGAVKAAPTIAKGAQDAVNNSPDAQDAATAASQQQGTQ